MKVTMAVIPSIGIASSLCRSSKLLVVLQHYVFSVVCI